MFNSVITILYTFWILLPRQKPTIVAPYTVVTSDLSESGAFLRYTDPTALKVVGVSDSTVS